MAWFIAKFKWIMLVCGLVTSTMFYAAFAPQDALLSNFGETLDGPLADLLVRSWGSLVGLVGVMLIYGALHPPARTMALLIAGLSKILFIGLVLSHGTRFLYYAHLSLFVDAVMVGLFAVYLVASRRAVHD